MNGMIGCAPSLNSIARVAHVNRAFEQRGSGGGTENRVIVGVWEGGGRLVSTFYIWGRMPGSMLLSTGTRHGNDSGHSIGWELLVLGFWGVLGCEGEEFRRWENGGGGV